MIGGQVMRCFHPYRPSRDVDFGVRSAKDLDGLVRQLRKRGRVAVVERTPDGAPVRELEIRRRIVDVVDAPPRSKGPAKGRQPRRAPR